MKVYTYELWIFVRVPERAMKARLEMPLRHLDDVAKVVREPNVLP